MHEVACALLLTCNFKEGPFHFWWMRRHLTFIQAFIPACYINDFQSKIIGVSEAQGDTFVPAVSTFANRQKVNRVVFVV